MLGDAVVRAVVRGVPVLRKVAYRYDDTTTDAGERIKDLIKNPRLIILTHDYGLEMGQELSPFDQRIGRSAELRTVESSGAGPLSSQSRPIFAGVWSVGMEC